MQQARNSNGTSLKPLNLLRSRFLNEVDVQAESVVLNCRHSGIFRPISHLTGGPFN